MRLIFWLILKLCNPHAIRITISSNPNLWHLNRSLTIRHFFIPPIACSTLILIPEILLFSCFSSEVSSFPLDFFLGMYTLMPFGLCPWKPVSCQSLIPLGSERDSSSHIFLSWVWPSYVELSQTILRLQVHSRLFFMLWVFFTTIACHLPVFIHRTQNGSLCTIQ